MKVAVYQSYRTSHVPVWLEACMQSVRSWAKDYGLDYHFIGDELFELAPAWYRDKAGGEICPVADLARLVMAKKLLAQGYDLTIWVDADVLVFRPESMRLLIQQGYAFCHEIWIRLDDNGRPVPVHRVNNAITMFSRKNVHLDFFIDACLQIAHHSAVLGKLAVGTDFLSQLRHILPFPLIENAGMLSPALMKDIVHNEQHHLPTYAAELRAPLACANLCASLEGEPMPGFTLDTRVFETVVEACQRSKGDIVNLFYKAPPR